MSTSARWRHGFQRCNRRDGDNAELIWITPQSEILMELARARKRTRQRIRRRTDDVETSENPADIPESTAREEDVEEDNPQELGRDGDCLEKQVKEEDTTAREGNVEE